MISKRVRKYLWLTAVALALPLVVCVTFVVWLLQHPLYEIVIVADTDELRDFCQCRRFRLVYGEDRELVVVNYRDLNGDEHISTPSSRDWPAWQMRYDIIQSIRDALLQKWRLHQPPAIRDRKGQVFLRDTWPSLVFLEKGS